MCEIDGVVKVMWGLILTCGKWGGAGSKTRDARACGSRGNVISCANCIGIFSLALASQKKSDVSHVFWKLSII